MLTIVWLTAAPLRNQRPNFPRRMTNLPTIHRFAISCDTYKQASDALGCRQSPERWGIAPSRGHRRRLRCNPPRAVHASCRVRPADDPLPNHQ